MPRIYFKILERIGENTIGKKNDSELIILETGQRIHKVPLSSSLSLFVDDYILPSFKVFYKESSRNHPFLTETSPNSLASGLRSELEAERKKNSVGPHGVRGSRSK